MHRSTEYGNLVCIMEASRTRWEARESSAALFDILSGYILVNLECSMFLTSLAPKKTYINVTYCRVKCFCFIVADSPYYE